MSYLDSEGLTRLWGKIKSFFSSKQYVPEEPLLTTMQNSATLVMGALVSEGVVTANANYNYSAASIADMGVAVGDTLRVRAQHTYNSSAHVFVVAFFNTTTTDPETGTTTTPDVAIGDVAISYFQFSHQGAEKVLGEVVIPEGTTHVVLSHYKRDYRTWVDVRKVDVTADKLQVSIEDDYLENWRTRYPLSARAHVRGDNGNKSSTYGNSGVYYMINDYIDVRYVKELHYLLETAAAGYSGQGGMALLAAYDANKAYVAESSIITTAATTRVGVWTRPSNICYIRLTICTTKGKIYCINPDRIGTLERKVAAILSSM